MLAVDFEPPDPPLNGEHPAAPAAAVAGTGTMIMRKHGFFISFSLVYQYNLLDGVIDTISKKWALLIIHVLGNTARLRFNELMIGLDGISPKMLSDTLAALRKEGFIGREAFSELPPRVEYFLTDDGKELWDAILPLLQWTTRRENFSVKECSARCGRKPPHN